MAKSLCDNCPYHNTDNTCKLPIGKAGDPKSAREHYRKYFKCPCPRGKDEQEEP